MPDALIILKARHETHWWARMPDALFGVKAEAEDCPRYVTAERMWNPLAGAYANRLFRTKGRTRKPLWVCYRGADEKPAGGWGL
jgi:hypothetical protein